MTARSRAQLPTLDELEKKPDFKTDGEKSWCIHCGAVKEMSAKWFLAHYRECVEPRSKEL